MGLCWWAMAMAMARLSSIVLLVCGEKQTTEKFEHQKFEDSIIEKSKALKFEHPNTERSARRAPNGLDMPSGKLRITPAFVCGGGWRQIMSKTDRKHSFNRICSIFVFCAQQALALLRVAAQ